MVASPQAKPKKKSELPPKFPTDPVAAEFCRWFWTGSRGWDLISGNAPTPEQKTRWTTEPYPIQPDELWLRHQDPGEAIGVSFKNLTPYLCIDIDRGSFYHPENSEESYTELLAALQGIGLIQPVVTLSSWSDGLHISS